MAAMPKFFLLLCVIAVCRGLPYSTAEDSAGSHEQVQRESFDPKGDPDESRIGEGGYESHVDQGGYESHSAQGGYESHVDQGGYESHYGQNGYESRYGQVGYQSHENQYGPVEVRTVHESENGEVNDIRDCGLIGLVLDIPLHVIGSLLDIGKRLVSHAVSKRDTFRRIIEPIAPNFGPNMRIIDGGNGFGYGYGGWNFPLSFGSGCERRVPTRFTVAEPIPAMVRPIAAPAVVIKPFVVPVAVANLAGSQSADLGDGLRDGQSTVAGLSSSAGSSAVADSDSDSCFSPDSVSSASASSSSAADAGSDSDFYSSPDSDCSAGASSSASSGGNSGSSGSASVSASASASATS